uniref:HTH OST-type domain-containing protein n=1 Tax=Steinernema glaseri TaxID=37863 RepID=A0A1I7Y8Y2_9BILA
MSNSFSELKNRIRVLLPPRAEPCSISQLVNGYWRVHGEHLPFGEFGFNSARDLLETESMRDIALVTAHPNGFVTVQAAQTSSGATSSASDISDKPRRRRERIARPESAKSPVIKAPLSAELTTIPYPPASRSRKLKSAAEILDEELPSKHDLLAEIKRRNGIMRISELDLFCVRNYGFPLSLENAKRILGTKQATCRLEAFTMAFQNELHVQYSLDGNHLLKELKKSKPVVRPSPATDAETSHEVQYARLLADFLTGYIREQAGIRLFVTDVARVLLHRYGHIPQFSVPKDYDGCLQLVKHLVACSDGNLELSYVGDLGFLKLAEDIPVGAPDWNGNNKQHNCRVS